MFLCSDRSSLSGVFLVLATYLSLLPLQHVFFLSFAPTALLCSHLFWSTPRLVVWPITVHRFSEMSCCPLSELCERSKKSLLTAAASSDVIFTCGSFSPTAAGLCMLFLKKIETLTESSKVVSKWQVKRKGNKWKLLISEWKWFIHAKFNLHKVSSTLSVRTWSTGLRL